MKSTSAKKTKLDSLAREVVLRRGHCQNPNCTHFISEYNRLCWSHIISRRFLNIRWLPENALCLCLKCEQYFTDHPNEQRAFFISIIGEDLYFELKFRSTKIEYIDYEKIESDLKKLLLRS